MILSDIRWSYIPILLLCVPANLAAQDSLNDPRISQAIPVRREPRHHDVFENDWVRVLDVHIPPGDTTLFHKHATPSVFIVLTQTKTGSQVLIEPARIQLTYGNIWFEGFYDKPRVHRVWNSDTTEFHVMDVELVHATPVRLDPPEPSTPTDSLLFDEKPVRAFRQIINAHQTTRTGQSRQPLLIIRLGESLGNSSQSSTGKNASAKFTVNGKALAKKGDYCFVPSGEALVYVNGGDQPVSVARFVLK